MTAGFTMMELAIEVLKVAPTPMSSIELWAFADQKGLAAKVPPGRPRGTAWAP